MLDRLEIEQEVVRCLRYSHEEAAGRQLARVTQGWEMQYGYLPTRLDNPDEELRIICDASDLLQNYILRRTSPNAQLAIDPVCFVTQRPPLPVRMIGGVGIWLSTQTGLTTEVG